MSRCPRSPLLFFLAAACARPVEEPPPGKPTPAPPSLPLGYAVKGTPEVKEPFLPPDATWRWLVSELRLRQAEGGEILVTFEPARVHFTDRQGRRLTYRLPKGLRLSGAPANVLLRPNLAIEIVRESGAQVVGAEEVTVVTARIDMGGGNVQEFRLVAKGGAGFRSISTGGEAG